MPGHIGTLNEKPLHEALKQWYARTNDKFEVPVDGFVIDIVRGKLLIEIQTRNFTAIKRKLEKLLVNHRVRLVYPIPCEKWLIKQSNDNDGAFSRRKSPGRGVYESVFNELVHLPQILVNPDFSLDLLLIQEEEVRRYDGIRGWRRHGWVTDERRLLKVVEHRILSKPSDICAFVPSSLDEPFTVSELAAAIRKPRRLAQKMAYCMRLMGCIKPVGKRANAILYARLNARIAPL